MEYLRKLGWNNIDVNKGYIISYCETCRTQRMYYCTGKKEDNGHTILRLECDVCQEKLKGNGYNG